MNLPSILLWGFAATMILTTVIVAAQSLGLTRIDIPFIVGSMFTANRDRARILGYALHVMNGWWFAIIYALFFEELRMATWWLREGKAVKRLPPLSASWDEPGKAKPTGPRQMSGLKQMNLIITWPVRSFMSSCAWGLFCWAFRPNRPLQPVV